MSVIAEFTVPADEFPLGHLLEVRPGVQVRLEPMIPTDESVVPCFWVRSPDIEAVRDALRESPLVEEVHVLDEVDDEVLFRVEWTGDIDGMVDSISDHDAVLLDGRGHGDNWSFQLRFHDHDALSAFYRDVVDKDIPVDLESIHDPVESPGARDLGLSSAQREALRLAFEEGYFDVPRGTTLVELAGELGISDSAASQRIRRGLVKIVSATLVQDTG